LHICHLLSDYSSLSLMYYLYPPIAHRASIGEYDLGIWVAASAHHSPIF
jgi:hypothetical protein